jgi:hypothetical protein
MRLCATPALGEAALRISRQPKQIMSYTTWSLHCLAWGIMKDSSQTAPHAPAEPLDLGQSIAGEEDPGAAVDLAMAVGKPDRAAGRPGDDASTVQVPMSPGDEAPAGTSGTGENVCPRCGGSGKLANADCPMCQGTGKVTSGIGGA